MPPFIDTMTPSERELAEALRERLTIISDEDSRRDPDQHIKRLRGVSERIETLAAALPQPIPRRLAHFLDRHSYDKALEFLCSGDPS
jgi:hypothetical protein